MDVAERFWAKVNKTDRCCNWTGWLNNNGYGQFWVNGTNIKAHRYSYALNHPLTIDLLEGHREICVCHKCDNPRCVNPAHLFLGSHLDNMRDMEMKGRGNYAKGENNGKSNLTEEQVREIRIRYAEGGIKQEDLGIKYGVERTTISRIISRKTWKHLE